MPPSRNNVAPATPDWTSFEPYLQLVRCLLPRTSGIAVFDPDGQLQWSSDTITGPDLPILVGDARLTAQSAPEAGGQLRLLPGNLPVYLCWIRDDAAHLLAILAVMCRPSTDQEGEARSFGFAYALLRPAIECLRRDLIARTAIHQLNRTLSALDKDLELLLADGPADRPVPASSDGADELKGILHQAIEHLHASTAALIVPDKSITLACTGPQRPADTQFIARAHRQLLGVAQLRREPLIINRFPPNNTPDSMAYRILACPLRSLAGRTMGVLVLFRPHDDPNFTERDARLADILARKAVSVIESSYDVLTGLYTRPAFEQRVRAIVADLKGATHASHGHGREPAPRSDGEHAVRAQPAARHWSALYIDGDQLHVINDNLGMHVGDTILGQLGELIRHRLPPGAFAARISGDRFSVLLPSQLDDAERFAQSLREGVVNLGAAHGDSRLHVSISVGVAMLDIGAGDVMHSLAAAETACKAAKDRGRNRVEVYHNSDASIVRRFTDINIAGRLREAIDAGRLHLEAQLILPFAGAESARPHYELLVRMIDEDGRTIGPDRFMSAATRYQLMPLIDRWVINRAIEVLKPHAALLENRGIGFAINFSGQSLNDDGFADFVLERLGSSGLDPESFCFELTENASIANLARAQALMRGLRRFGCAVALDDFGTGLSSLSYLRQLPVTMLKIDGSFVRDVLKDPRAESMVRAIAQLARSMSLTTVAEYVETEEIRTRIATLGVDYGQGFAIGRPMPLSELLAELPVLAAAGATSRSLSESAVRRIQGRIQVVH